MPIGLILPPYSSSKTLLIQYQSPFRRSLTFIFSSDMATKNKGVPRRPRPRSRLIPPFTSGAIEGRVRGYLPFPGFGQCPVDVVHRSAEVPSDSRIFKFSNGEITQEVLPPRQEFPPGERFFGHPFPNRPGESLDQDFGFHTF